MEEENWASDAGDLFIILSNLKGWPLSAVTVPGQTHSSSDAGCREVTSLGHWWPVASGNWTRACWACRPQNRATWPAEGSYTVCSHSFGQDSPENWHMWAVRSNGHVSSSVNPTYPNGHRYLQISIDIHKIHKGNTRRVNVYRHSLAAS